MVNIYKCSDKNKLSFNLGCYTGSESITASRDCPFVFALRYSLTFIINIKIIQNHQKTGNEEKHNITRTGHQYAQTNTNNVNRAQITGGKDQTTIVFIRKS
jgi:hypothetical protein